MSVERLPAVAMIDHQNVAVPPIVPPGVDDNASVGGINRIPHLPADIDRAMIARFAVIVTRNIPFRSRPEERTAPFTILFFEYLWGWKTAGLVI